jgi:hypothetical protein
MPWLSSHAWVPGGAPRRTWIYEVVLAWDEQTGDGLIRRYQPPLTGPAQAHSRNPILIESATCHFSHNATPVKY